MAIEFDFNPPLSLSPESASSDDALCTLGGFSF